MTIEIIGNVDKDRLYCTGSFTKLLTTFVCLSKLSEQHDLATILDDDSFLDQLCQTQASKEFLHIFQNVIGSRFSIRDVCSFYNGLPYTFDVTAAEIESIDAGFPSKHHSLMDEATFLNLCRHHITQIDPNQGKFHYSELAIIFIGYLIEKVYDITIESLYQKYVIDAFHLKSSLFSRTRPKHVYTTDLSNHYDYPSIAIMDHGYFCYSNGFFTTLNDEKSLVEQLLTNPVFAVMTDITHARAASPTIMNGLTVEIRIVKDDVIYGYEGFSYSGCNIWAYSTKFKKGYLTFTDNEDTAYPLIYDHFGYSDFDKVPDHTQTLYRKFLKEQHYDFEERPIPDEYVGNYHRVNINDSQLEMIFTVSPQSITIRNPEMVEYGVVYDHGLYRTATKDHRHGIHIGFYQAKSGHHYMTFDGTVYRKIE